jgi:hypothetical protein
MRRKKMRIQLSKEMESIWERLEKEFQEELGRKEMDGILNLVEKQDISERN